MCPSILTIQQRVAASFGISHLDMTSRRQGWQTARPRQIAMYLARHLTQASLPEIGRAFGGRDHTTVMHAINAVERRIKDPGYWVVVERLREQLEGPVESL